MHNTPSVCIMIPTYNQASFILKAVESALAQDYSNLEIIIADDCSTDNTASLLAPLLENKKITYKKNAINLGRVANYRRCLYESVTAEWVINLDGDDYYTNSQFISEAIAAIKNAGEKDILFYQGSGIYKENGNEKILAPRIKADSLIITATSYFFDYFKNRHFFHMSTLYNRRLALQSGFYQKSDISTDIHSILQACLLFVNKKVIISKTISGVWLQHNNNTSKTAGIRQHLNNFKGYKELYQQAIEKGFDKISCLKWLVKARIIYLRIYIGTFIRNINR